MKRLTETISDFGDAMRDLGRLEATCNSTTDETLLTILKEDRDKVKVRIAKTKLDMLSAKTSNGRCLLDWNKDNASKFFELIN